MTIISLKMVLITDLKRMILVYYCCRHKKTKNDGGKENQDEEKNKVKGELKIHEFEEGIHLIREEDDGDKKVPEKI